MQFMLIHTHTTANCFAGRPEEARQFFFDLEASLSKGGVTVKGSYMASYAHTMYFILEAVDQGALHTALRPLLKFGTGQLVPVTSFTLADRAKL